jgi:hypothetical protein
MADKDKFRRAVDDIQTALYHQAAHLRQFNQEESDRIARRLDRLRQDLKKRVEGDGGQ